MAADTPPTWEGLLQAAQLLRDELISATEAAARQGVSFATLRRRIARNDIRALQIGRDVFVWRRDVK